MERNDLNVLIGGEAGQGLVTLGTALARSLVRSGYFVVVNQNYESRIRGGHNTFAIRIGTGEITSTRDSVDLLVAMDADTVALHEGDMADGGITVASAGSPGGSSGTLMVPYGELGDRRSANVAALGVVSDLLGLDGEVVAQALDDMLGKKDAKIAETNRNVLSEAVGWVSRQATEFPKLAPVASPGQRLLMHGNEAIALGALSAGVKFCAFYPMTPGTSVALNLAAQAERMGLVVEQAEDEIAAINMAIGASFAGAPSMVTTSGGGYALMAEGVSLAAMTETPVVVVVAQRPGPATGLPTRTEQADLEFVLHSGHGEFPRAIFAPGTVEECVWLTRKAFEVAARYQSPVFVLTDQFQADSYRAVEPFDFESLGPVDPGVAADAPATPYQRYAASPDGVSPRLLPGATRHLVVVDSDEHTEDGHLTEDLAARQRMMDKRLAKERGVMSEVAPPEATGDESPELLLVTWGSSRGAVLEAATQMRSTGARVGVLHFSQVWPLVPEQFIEALQEAGEVVCVEGNATGQLDRLIRRETGFAANRRVLRYDGLPITPEYIVGELSR